MGLSAKNDAIRGKKDSAKVAAQRDAVSAVHGRYLANFRSGRSEGVEAFFRFAAGWAVRTHNGAAVEASASELVEDWRRECVRRGWL